MSVLGWFWRILGAASLLERLLPRKRPKLDDTQPIPLMPQPEWHQRHAGRTVGDLLERQKRDEMPPPKRRPTP